MSHNLPTQILLQKIQIGVQTVDSIHKGNTTFLQSDQRFVSKMFIAKYNIDTTTKNLVCDDILETPIPSPSFIEQTVLETAIKGPLVTSHLLHKGNKMLGIPLRSSAHIHPNLHQWG